MMLPNACYNLTCVLVQILLWYTYMCQIIILSFLYNDTSLDCNIVSFHILYSSPLITDIQWLYSITLNHIFIKQLNPQTYSKLTVNTTGNLIGEVADNACVQLLLYSVDLCY